MRFSGLEMHENAFVLAAETLLWTGPHWGRLQCSHRVQIT